MNTTTDEKDKLISNLEQLEELVQKIRFINKEVFDIIKRKVPVKEATERELYVLPQMPK